MFPNDVKIQAKESAKACVQGLTQQYYNCAAAMSFRSFQERYTSSDDWSNCTFFPIVADDRASAMMVYYGSNPIYLKNAGVAATSELHYKGGWVPDPGEYHLIADQGTFTNPRTKRVEEVKVYTNAPYYKIDLGTVRTILGSVAQPRRRGYLTFIAQTNDVRSIHDDSWQFAVKACLAGSPTSCYTGALPEFDPMWRLANVEAKAGVANRLGMRLIVFGSQLVSNHENFITDDQFPYIVPSASRDQAALACANFFSSMAMQLALLDVHRDEVSTQSTEISQTLAASVREYKANPAEVDKFIADIAKMQFGGSGSTTADIKSFDMMLADFNDALTKASGDPKTNSATINNMQSTMAKITKAANDGRMATQATQVATILSFINLTDKRPGGVGETISKDTDFTPDAIQTENSLLRLHLGKPAVRSAKGPNPAAKAAAKEMNDKLKQNAFDLMKARHKRERDGTE